jgi:hypothetical protein
MSDASNWGVAQLNQMFKAASVRKNKVHDSQSFLLLDPGVP